MNAELRDGMEVALEQGNITFEELEATLEGVGLQHRAEDLRQHCVLLAADLKKKGDKEQALAWMLLDEALGQNRVIPSSHA